jgi:Fic family protein
MVFAPKFTYAHATVKRLGIIEGAKAVIDILPLPPDTRLRLRHDALQRSTRSSTQIEGNPLDAAAVRRAIAQGDRQGSKAEQEIRNYWRALDRVEEFAETKGQITEAFIQELHRIVIVLGPGRRGSRSSYRPGECPVVDTITGRIEYGPPEPKDVPPLMTDLVAWLSSSAQELPAPVRAALLTHRFLSIHPFEDGNGRTGRLLATAELWRSGYRMRGFFSFDEYFNADRDRYYRSLQMGLPMNFYDGRHDPDHSPWLNYFVETMAQAASDLKERSQSLYSAQNPAEPPWEELSRRQQQILTRLLARLLAREETEPLVIRAADVENWFGISNRTSREWLRDWGDNGFISPIQSGTGQRIQRYQLSDPWASLLNQATSKPDNSGS